MKYLSKNIFTAALVLASGITASAQTNNTGVIEYEVNAKMDSRMRGGGGNSDNGDAPERVITFTQQFFFNAGSGKLETQRPDFGGRNGNRGGNGEGRAQRDAGNRGNRPRMRGGFGNNQQYVNLADKKYLQVITAANDSTKFYYTEEDYAAPKDVKLSSKTKKIAGYTCKTATVTLRDETYTVWYTQDLPFSYSPVNGLLPEDKGVVLAAESSRRAFSAKKIDLKAIAATDTAIPANAEKISEEKLRELRRERMQQIRERQNSN